MRQEIVNKQDISTMKISVALCTYNGEEFLTEQLNSFITQTRLPDEIVVCDDCSRDKTVKIIHDFAARAPFQVRLYVNETNLHTIKNFEKAISLCTGDIIALSDQDDVWHCDKLKIFEEVFNAKPRVGLVFCDANLVDANLAKLGYSNWEQSGLDLQTQKLITTKASLNYLFKKPLVWGCMMAFRAKFKDIVLPIPDDVPGIYHDYWISWLLSAVSYLEPIPNRLVEYRQHSAQQLGQQIPSKAEQISSKDNLIKLVQSKYNFNDIIVGMMALRERLELTALHFKVEDSIKIVNSRLHHFVNRRKILSGDKKKILLVAKELFTLRYHHHSSGLKSVAKDLFFG